MNFNHKPYKIAIYLRVSTAEQAENPEGSIKNQEYRIREFIKLKNLDGNFGEVVSVFCDAGISAKDTNRPELQKLLEDIKLQKINLVMVTEISRFTRSVKDFSTLVDFLSEHNCKLQSLRDNFDTTTAAGEMVMHMMANFAQFERKQIGERIANSFLSRAKRGLYNGGSVPLGYKISEVSRGHLEIIETEAEIVRLAFTTFLREGTLASAAKAMNAKGITLCRQVKGGGTTRVGHIMLETLYRILTNKMYLGIRSFMERDEIKETKACWDAIIDQDTFVRVGEILSKNKSRNKSGLKSRYPYLLTGVLFCQCGERLCGKSAHGNGGKVGYYEHTWRTKIQSGLKDKVFHCELNRIQVKKVEPIVWQAIRSFLMDEEFFKGIYSEAQKLKTDNSQQIQIDRNQNKIYSIHSQLDALSERLGLLPKTIDPKHVIQQMERLSHNKRVIEEELKQLKINSQVKLPASLDSFEAFRNTIKQLLEQEDDSKVKTTIIQKLVHKIIIKPEGLEVWFHVGESHIKKKLGIPGSFLYTPKSRQSKPLPIFQGNNQTSNLLHLDFSNNFYDAGSNSLKIGRPSRT